MRTEEILRIHKLAVRIRTMSLVSQEGRINELSEEDVNALLEMQQEQAVEIENLTRKALNHVTNR
ncbi:hypothetical protein [Vibrio harveyi]|uniref:hypothetical protein n=1 Tax=Vibrio harveyi TaxID=669 RepID=UPI003BB49B65